MRESVLLSAWRFFCVAVICMLAHGAEANRAVKLRSADESSRAYESSIGSEPTQAAIFEMRKRVKGATAD